MNKHNEPDRILHAGRLRRERAGLPAQVTAKPKSLPRDIAGGFSANGVGAHMCLREMKVGPGDTVLIHAAAGALGTFTVQLALAWGASTVIDTAGEANHDHLRSMGVIPVACEGGVWTGCPG